MSRRKRHMYLGVTVLAGLALAVDSFILPDTATDPQPAAAQSAGAHSRASASPSAPTVPLLSVPELPFPRGVEPAYDRQRPIRDMFAPPEVMRDDTEAPTDKDDGGGAGPGRPRPANCDTFMSQHRLDAVIIQPRLRIAVVDGAWLQIGQSLDGCILATISGNEVRFSCRDGDATLTVSAADTLLRR